MPQGASGLQPEHEIYAPASQGNAGPPSRASRIANRARAGEIIEVLDAGHVSERAIRASAGRVPAVCMREVSRGLTVEADRGEERSDGLE